MGLIVITSIALLLAFGHRAWRKLRGNPLPGVYARPRPGAPVRQFLGGIGKAKRPAPGGPALSAEQVDRWRLTAEAARRSADGVPSPGTDCDVLVVGAGPSGLMMAALLVRRGVQVRIVDKNGGPATESRAFAVQARTIELFRSIGLADQLLSHGIMTTGIRFHVKGKEAGGLDFDRAAAPDTPYQFILMAPQCEVEEILLKDLADHGVTVERQTRLESFVQTDVAVTAKLAGDDGTGSRTITSRYIVGADGAHSAVRRQLGLDFEGGSYTQRFLLADCTVEWPFDHTQFRVFVNGERIALFLPLRGRELSRVMTTDIPPAGDTGQAREGLDLERLQAELRRSMGVPVTLSEPVWLATYGVYLRQVHRYRVGRAFLVGDAAHIHSPAGGQGMNTGLHDAANLAWKLAAVLRTNADDALLDSYSIERHRIGKEVLRLSDRMYQLTAGLTGVRARLRDAVAPFVVRRASAAPIPHRRSFRKLSQLAMAYRPSACTVNEVLYSLKGPHAGQRAPEARLNVRRSVHDLLEGYQLQVLAISRRPLAEDEVTEQLAQLNSIAAFGDGIGVHLVTRVGGRPDDRIEQVDSIEVFDRYGLTEPRSQALYVIRPDGHVAWRTDELDYDGCRRFLSRLHGGIAAAEECRLGQAD